MYSMHKRSSYEVILYYFRLHDTSADRKLDGLELLSALSHGINSYIVRMEERDKPLPPERISKMYDNIQSKLNKGAVIYYREGGL